MSKIQLKIHLPWFKRKWANKNWDDVFSLNGLPLSDELAHAFVDRAIAEGYKYDVDVPDEKVREWLGLNKKGDEMANDNETVEQVALSDRPLADQIRIIRDNYSIGSGEFDALDEAADVVECNQREISGLKGERKGILKANDSLAADNTRLRDELAAKDSMIAEQSAVNESQAAQLRDALNEFEELKCAIADSKRISDAVVKSLRDKNLEMEGEIAAKDAEIEKLRALVNGLADVVYTTRPKFCNGCPAVLCTIGGKLCDFVRNADELVEKARELVK